MRLKKDNIVTPEARNFFKNIKRKEDLDESTFNIWKTELQKDLPNFWESMTGLNKKN